MDTVYRKRYFISRHGRQAGPYTKEQLQALNIHADTSVWNEEAMDWKSADTFEDLKDVLSAPPPPEVHRGPLHWLRIGRKRQG
jgi:hypothetical protein